MCEPFSRRDTEVRLQLHPDIAHPFLAREALNRRQGGVVRGQHAECLKVNSGALRHFDGWR